jgi:hypothetical protein
MQKIKLAVETLEVQSFVTSDVDTNRGTVMGHAPSNGGGPNCNSAIDACPTGLCPPDTFSPDVCPTVDPQYCESADDACPSGRGCTEVGC